MAGRNKTKVRSLLGGILIFVAIVAAAPTSCPAAIEDELETTRAEVRQLRQMVEELVRQVHQLKEGKTEEKQLHTEYRHELNQIRDDVTKINDSSWLASDSPLNKLTLGGYGEVHANFNQNSDTDKIDFHRLVMYLGYDFADWIKFNSEIEIEHAFINDGDGEISVEQAYVDFLLSDKLNVRAGRILTPLGIVNKKHEPPTFNGVERPSFAKYIIPTTWSSDGVGIFGSLNPALTYEAYVVGGLDGSQFTATNGIRNGRIKESPSLHEPAFTGRLDFYPLTDLESSSRQDLRLGISAYLGGLDNGNGGSNPDISGDIALYSADFEYSLRNFDFRGAIAHSAIDGARQIGNGAAEEIFGWYLEGGYHFWPDEWKRGKLEKSDAVAFLRYDDFDTQYKMPSGVAKNPAGDRTEWTLGVNFYLTPDFVIKADYQITDDASSKNPNDRFNLGLGWQF